MGRIAKNILASFYCLLSLGLSVQLVHADHKNPSKAISRITKCLKPIRSNQSAKRFAHKLSKLGNKKAIVITPKCKARALSNSVVAASESVLAVGTSKVSLTSTGSANTLPLTDCTAARRSDINLDDKVDFADLLLLASNYQKSTASSTNQRADIDRNGMVDFGDLLAVAQSYGKPVCKPFKIFDSVLGYTNQPTPIHPIAINAGITSAGNFFRSIPGTPLYDTSEPDEAITRATARNMTGDSMLLNIEAWPIDPRIKPLDQVRDSINKYLRVISWIRSENPTLKIGIYSIFPLSDYWVTHDYQIALDIIAQGPSHPQYSWAQLVFPGREAAYRRWQEANNFLSDIGAAVDYIQPGLYMWTESPVGFDAFAKHHILESRRLAPTKKVYPVIWPRLTYSATGGNPLISYSSMLQYFYSLDSHGADGVVIWDAGHNRPWEIFPWVTALQSFLNLF